MCDVDVRAVSQTEQDLCINNLCYTLYIFDPNASKWDKTDFDRWQGEIL